MVKAGKRLCVNDKCSRGERELPSGQEERGRLWPPEQGNPPMVLGKAQSSYKNNGSPEKSGPRASWFPASV